MTESFYETFRDQSNTSLISENHNNMFPKHFHKNIELHYVLKGKIRAVINGQSFILEKGAMILIPPFFAHEFSTVEESDSIILLPSSDLIGNFQELFSKELPPIFLLDVEYNQTILLILKALLKCSQDINRKTLSRFINIVLDLILAHYPSHRPSTKNEYNQLFNISISIQTYIDQHYAEELTLDKIAEELGYSKYYISRSIKKYINKNFYEYVNMVRINYFVALYPTQNCSIEKFARECGFQNTTTFFRAFRAVHGTTPKEFFKESATTLEHAKTCFKYTTPQK